MVLARHRVFFDEILYVFLSLLREKNVHFGDCI